MEQTNDNKALKFDLLDKKAFEDEIESGAKCISIGVQTKVGELSEWPEQFDDLVLARTTPRGSRVYVGGIEYEKETGVISFAIAEEVPTSFPFDRLKDMDDSEGVATTFADFCWIVSQGTTNLNKDEVETPYRDEVPLGDLTWMITDKFADDVLDMMHIMNSFILEGNLYQAIMYGPKFQVQ